MSSVVTVHTRPGCLFSASLVRSLERLGVDHDVRDIWEDPAAAAVVRSVTGGAETVPTVVVGEVALVNPTAADVLRVLAEVAPEHVPDGYEPPRPGPLARLVTRLLGG